MSSPDETTLRNPYAAPNSDSAETARSDERNSARTACRWLTGVTILQIVMLACNINSLQQTVPLLQLKRAQFHLCTMVGIAICTSLLLMLRHGTKSAFILSEFINLAQWITLPISAWILHTIGFTDVPTRESDVWFFAKFWLGSSVAIAAVCAVMDRIMLKKKDDETFPGCGTIESPEKKLRDQRAH